MPQIRQIMTGIVAQEPGGPDVLKAKEFAVPKPAAGEVLVKVAAAGINRNDVLQRAGKYNRPEGATEILGLEISGEVVAVGREQERWKVGDKICSLLAGGGYAEYVCVPEGQCLPWPENLSAEEAAALPECVFTVWANIFETGRLKAGETALVHGGGSGVGTTAIQMIRAADADVIVTVGKDDKKDICLKLGAIAAINYETHDFVKEVTDITKGRGVDIVLDMVGGPYIERNMNAMALRGRHISIANISGVNAELNIRLLMKKRLTLVGSTLRNRNVVEKTRLRDAIEQYVWPWAKAGKLKPHVFQSFPLKSAAEAHKLMESGAYVGKIVLTLDA